MAAALSAVCANAHDETRTITTAMRCCQLRIPRSSTRSILPLRRAAAQCSIRETGTSRSHSADGRRSLAATMLDMKHIGIVACSAEGAALCYRTIALEGAKIIGAHDHPEVSLHNHSLAEYMKFIYRDDWNGVAELMLSSANKLAKTGAEFLICPDNTIHQALPRMRSRSPLPWLHIAEVVAGEAVARGFRKIAITGTKYLTSS